MSKRNNIVSNIIENLKLIDGEVSSFDNSYTYTQSVFNNVYRGFKFFDSINDFPSIYVLGGVEQRIYNSANLVEGLLPVSIRFFHKSNNTRNEINDLLEDIEHVIYNIPDNPEQGVEDIIIESMSTDEGLLQNNDGGGYGMGELSLIVKYVL